jgi:hypothetical protein
MLRFAILAVSVGLVVPFENTVTVQAGQPTRFDIVLIENVGGRTLGDDPGIEFVCENNTTQYLVGK